MKFDYTFLDPSAGIGGDTVVETDSPAFQRRINWLLANGAPLDYSIVIGFDFAPATDGNGNVVPGQHIAVQKGEIVWILGGFPISTNVWLAYRSPEIALVEILKVYGKPLPSPMPVFNVVPPPPPTTPDWEAPSAPIKGPMIGQPGRFFDNPDKYDNEGDLWTGPSGRQYQSRRAGYGFFAYRYWQQLGQ